MKLAIVNDVHVGRPLERDNVERAASHLAGEALPHLLSHIRTQHSPDVIINLGDLIRSENKESDLKNYQQAIAPFTKADCPIIHLLGNHEIKRISTPEIEEIWRNAGFDQTSYGMREMGGLALIWLGMEYQPHRRFKHKLPDDQLAWLAETLQQTTLPTIILTHCAVDDQDVNGNYFYEGYDIKNKDGFFLENYEQVQKVIASSESVEIVVQAHLHYFHTKLINHLPYVTCPAMADNICGPNTSGHIPEIYSVLAVDEEQIVLKAFSREYCFAGVEFPLKNKKPKDSSVKTL